MNRQDKFFEAFRKQQQQLDEMPSPQTWDRLQKRLDNRKKRRSTVSIYRLVTMVAAIIGLVLVASSVVYFANSTNRQALKIQEVSDCTPEVLQKAIQATTYRTNHQLALQQGIEEGNPNKVLIHKEFIRPILIPRKKRGI